MQKFSIPGREDPYVNVGFDIILSLYTSYIL
jgi:hypothetical protein